MVINQMITHPQSMGWNAKCIIMIFIGHLQSNHEINIYEYAGARERFLLRGGPTNKKIRF